MSIVTRAINMITRPKEEWAIIANEPASFGGLFTGYAMLLALIPAISSLVFGVLIGGIIGASSGSPLGATSLVTLTIGTEVVKYIMGLLLLLAMIFIVNAIAPSFGGKQDTVQVAKLMIYASTPVWLAGILAGIPVIGHLAAFAGAAYTLYLIYLGVGPLLAMAEDKIAGMTVVTALVYIVLWVVIVLFISVAVVTMFFSSSMMAGAMVGA
jgi:Yip1 domain